MAARTDLATDPDQILLAAFRAHHRDGLERVCRVRDAIPNYDALLSARINDEIVTQIDPAESIDTLRVRASKVARKKIARKTYKLFRPQITSFACEGRSANNLREFDFFDRLCAPIGISLARANLSDLKKVAMVEITPDRLAFLNLIVDDVDAFYAGRHQISAGLVHQQILYTRTFLTYVFSFSRKDARLPRALVQANDHSPVRVALSMVMKSYGVPRIYLQHAAVAQNFPALDFDHSVLHNRQSLGVYEKIGPVDGDVHILPRSPYAPNLEKLFASRDGKTDVVIYPTSQVNEVALHRIIDRLEDNPDVARIFLKPHPSTRHAIDTAALEDRIQFVEETPPEEHVAIVGNSSVALELLGQGIQVYQYFDLDSVGRDYYGFVRAKLTFEVDDTALTGPFWGQYSYQDGWIETFTQIEPRMNLAWLRDRIAFLKAMRDIRNTARVDPPLLFDQRPQKRRGNPFSWKRQWKRLRRWIKAQYGAPRKGKGPTVKKKGARRDPEAISTFLMSAPASRDDPSEWQEYYQTLRRFDEDVLLRKLAAFFTDRNPVFNRLLAVAPHFAMETPVESWLILKGAELGQIRLSVADLDRHLGVLKRSGISKSTRNKLEDTLLAVLLRDGSVDQIEMFFKASIRTFDSLPVNKKLAFYHRLTSDSAMAEQAAQIRAELVASPDPFDRLKALNGVTLLGEVQPETDHRKMEEAFVKVAPAGLVDEVANVIAAIYDSLRPRLKFMEIRTNADQRDVIIRELTDALRACRGLAMMRLSDGEGYLFADSHLFTNADRANRERHWWGMELPSELRQEIAHRGRTAVGQADIVGVPSIYRFIRDASRYKLSFAETVQGRGLLEVLFSAPIWMKPDAYLTEDKVNVALFSTPDDLGALVDAAKKIVVVSSLKEEFVRAVLPNRSEIRVIEIPTHYRTTANDKYCSDGKPLPFSFASIEAEVATIVAPGDLVLVAGGVIGKVLLAHARALGAVALDVGHCIDDWVSGGLPTIR